MIVDEQRKKSRWNNKNLWILLALILLLVAIQPLSILGNFLLTPVSQEPEVITTQVQRGGATFSAPQSVLCTNCYNVTAFNDSVTVIVSSGTGTGVSTNFSYILKQIIVIPTTNANTYNFKAYETSSGRIIDEDRVNHEGIWHIMKDYAIINDTITINITNATIDEAFTVELRYVT